MPTNGMTSHYREPGWFTKHEFNTPWPEPPGWV